MSDWKKQRARELRVQMTDAERALWRILRQRQLDDWKFRRQQPLGDYLADFFCAEARLVLEVDGGQHGGAGDRQRDAWMQAQGLHVLRFWNDEVLANPTGRTSVSMRSWKSCHVEANITPMPMPDRFGGSESKKSTPIPTLPP